MIFPVLKASSYILIHTPDTLKHYGSTQVATRAKDSHDDYLKQLNRHLRDFKQVVNYAPNQCYIGNLLPDQLTEINQPWYGEANLLEGKRFGELGELMPEDEFYGLVKHVDSFDLVKLTAAFTKQVQEKLAEHPIFSQQNLALGAGNELSEIKHLLAEQDAAPLYFKDQLVGCIKRAHESDKNLNSHVMLENLMAKASAYLAIINLQAKSGVDLSTVEYVVECSEEACGDINQRGGGNFAKAIAESAGCINATGVDMRSFCAGPTHALVNSAALVKAGVYKNVLVVAGGSVAKLGMNGKDHVKKEMPVLEDVLGGFAALITANDGLSPVIRTDVIGRHKVGTGSSPQAVISSLVTEPLDQNKLKLVDIDRYSVEMQNPEITKPAGAGNVPEANYKMIAALGVKRGDLEKKDLMDFVKKHGMPGFAPTQGHIPSGIPFLGHAIKMMADNTIEKAMIIGKGSLFLGRMTNQFDGVSFLLEKNNGTVAPEEGYNSEEVKRLFAAAMRKVADSLLGEGE